jgi:pimeloyl-ACP methyl ester carboxylesterase
MRSHHGEGGPVPKEPMEDVIVLLPGILGSVLQKDGKDVWAVSGGAAVSAILSLGHSIGDLELHGDDPAADDLGDGVTAPRLMSDVHLIPGLWKIDGYTKVAQSIRGGFDVTPGENYFEFPYDWRRDNRVHARRLARQSHDWLNAWRARSGNADAKLILIGHSMGGLVARHFLEVLDGWSDTRLLITFGTPYRGSLNALDFIATGMKKKLGPITLLDLTDLLRSFTSVYQLLPIYPCVDAGEGTLMRATEVAGIPGFDAERAASALDFHRAIADAVTAHQADPAYTDHGYGIQPIAGVFQPTWQSAKLVGGGLEVVASYEGKDMGGDGTVPSVSATPLELSNQDREVYVKERHASLQNADHALEQVIGVLKRQTIDQTRFFAPQAGVSLDVEDAYLSGTPVPVRALPEVEWASLTATVEDAGSGNVVATARLRSGAEGWHVGEVGPFPQGTYRVRVGGDGAIDPVTDVFAVFDEGRDVGG